MAYAHVTPDGTYWKAVGNGSIQISRTLLQADATSAARTWLRNNGGGELSIHGEDGRVRAKDTVAPGNDPRGTRG
jgi:hypothetical protein